MPDCQYKSAWLSLSLSPDGRKAVGIHSGRLELIDLEHSSARLLGEGFAKAAWSPDGQWVAALENGGRSRTILLTTDGFTTRKILGTTEAERSPDSRYLLSVSARDHCGPDYGTLEYVEVATGKRSVIESSRCKVNQTTTGW